MQPAEGIVYLSVWAALFCYPAGPLGRGLDSPERRRIARMVWSLGCLFFWIHVVSAFGVFYRWSHHVAWVETARQTREMTGFDSGSGLYWNYAFVLLWTLDVARWWRRPKRTSVGSLAGFLALHTFFLFMIFNGAVIFVAGPRRWLGLSIALVGAAAVGWVVARESKGRRAGGAPRR